MSCTLSCLALQVVRQLESRMDGGVIEVCRFSEAREAHCNDGLDNDCDGLVDAAVSVTCEARPAHTFLRAARLHRVAACMPYPTSTPCVR
jgi:hypothetical protein